MKILHTSDWHVGRGIRGRSRADEHAAVLTEIAHVADEEQVDLVLVAGDQFDVKHPSAESERIVYEALLRLADTGAHVLAIAGNHDAHRRVAATAPLMSRTHIGVLSAVAAPANGGVVTVTARSDDAVARVALLPWMSRGGVIGADDLMAGHKADEPSGKTSHSGTYEEHYRHVVGRLVAAPQPSDVNVVMAHAAMKEGLPGGGERAAETVMEYCVGTDVFPSNLDYVALGHYHRPQRLSYACEVHYSGAPMQLTFGETFADADPADAPCVMIVEKAGAGVPTTVRRRPLTAPRRLTTVRGSYEEVVAADPAEADYVRIVVTDRPPAGGIDTLHERHPNAVDVLVRPTSRTAPTHAPTTPTRAGREPRELFAEYLTENDAENDAVLALFDRLEEQQVAHEQETG